MYIIGTDEDYAKVSSRDAGIPGVESRAKVDGLNFITIDPKAINTSMSFK